MRIGPGLRPLPEMVIRGYGLSGSVKMTTAVIAAPINVNVPQVAPKAIKYLMACSVLASQSTLLAALSPRLAGRATRSMLKAARSTDARISHQLKTPAMVSACTAACAPR